MSIQRPLDALPEGTKLAGYVIGRVLGRGGFGVTYFAQDALYPLSVGKSPAEIHLGRQSADLAALRQNARGAAWPGRRFEAPNGR